MTQEKNSHDSKIFPRNAVVWKLEILENYPKMSKSKKSSTRADAMAGRGGKQQSVQIEIRNQEEWDALIPRQGLTVVDVYASWCGPCKAIVSLFRNIKNKQSDDFLSFATADAATIDSLEDYRGKSEPTFLFYGSGHLVCVLRGVNGPQITKVVDDLVKKEREIVEGKVVRERFVDKAVSPEEEEKEEDEGKEEEEEEVNQEENELAKEMTIRKSAGKVSAKTFVPYALLPAILDPFAFNFILGPLHVFYL